MPVNFTPMHIYVPGLSSANEWLGMVLARHPYRLSSSVSSAVMQALRKANARQERRYWAEREGMSKGVLQKVSGSLDGRLSSSKHESADDVDRKKPSLTRYHASVQEVPFTEEPEFPRSQSDTSSPTTALIVYNPAPVLKLTALDFTQFARQPEPSPATAQTTLFLAAMLIAVSQVRLSLLKNLENLEHDTPKPYESQFFAFAPPQTSPRPDRPRSLSGSTVADGPHEEPLSFSAISKVYSSDGATRGVQWERREEAVSPKRPKLSQFKQVSSGRVATLMDRFEKYHV